MRGCWGDSASMILGRTRTTPATDTFAAEAGTAAGEEGGQKCGLRADSHCSLTAGATLPPSGSHHRATTAQLRDAADPVGQWAHCRA